MNAILLSILLSAPGPLIVVPNASGLTSLGASGVSCFHDADNSVSMCVKTDDTLGIAMYGSATRTDVAAAPLSIVGKAPLNTFATANTAGGDINLTPASGLVKITGVTRAGTTGDIITVIFRKIGVAAATTVTLTEGDGTGGTFECDGAADDNTCVSNFVTAFNANAGLTGYLLAVYVAASETASIGVVDGMTASITSVVSNDTANFVTTQGAGGQVTFPVGSLTVNGISPMGDPDTGIYQTSVNTLSFDAGATRAFYVTSSGINLTGTVTSSGSPIVGYRNQAQALAAETLDVNDCSGVILNGTNNASFVLPNAAAANLGCQYTLINTGARTAVGIGFSPDASDNIAGSCGAIIIDGAVNKDLLNTAGTHEVGDSATIVSDGVGTWYITSCNGIWAHE